MTRTIFSEAHGLGAEVQAREIESDVAGVGPGSPPEALLLRHQSSYLPNVQQILHPARFGQPSTSY